jgi:hypothetical protein
VRFEPRIAFSVMSHERPGLEVLVNFGIFAGREATPAELDELAAELVAEAGQLAIVAERRYEFDERTEVQLHQVRVAVPADLLPSGTDEVERLRELIVSRTEYWARQCVERRHTELADLEPM